MALSEGKRLMIGAVVFLVFLVGLIIRHGLSIDGLTIGFGIAIGGSASLVLLLRELGV